MILSNGTYTTPAGSTLVVSGKHSGVFATAFDWVEEDACVDCRVDTVPVADGGEWFLCWSCSECNGGRACLQMGNDMIAKEMNMSTETEEKTYKGDLA